MSRTIIEVTYIDPKVCFECGAPATERHHVIPHFLGGTKTVPLCGKCHAKVHGIDGARRAKLAELTKAALAAKRARGETWVRNTNCTPAIVASAKARTEKRLAWVENSPAVKLARTREEQGVKKPQILEELNELYELDPKQWGTREGLRWSRANLHKVLKGDSPQKDNTPKISDVNKSTLEATKHKSNNKLTPQQYDNMRLGIQAYTQKRINEKKEWLQNSDACNYVRELYSSYKTRYLIASEKVELFNRRYVLMNGKKINSTGQWSKLKDELGFSGVVTVTSEKINFLYQWAQLCLERTVECKVIKRNSDYLITPINIIVVPAQIHLWNKFFDGLKADGVVGIRFDENNQVVYTFASNEIIKKIIKDIDNG